jgi:recombination protein RecT
MMATGLQKPQDDEKIRTTLLKASDRLQAVLSKGLTFEKVAEVVSTLCYRNPRIAECERGSIFAAVMQGSELGLSFSPSLGEAYLVPRFNGKLRIMEANFQAGYRGWAKLIHESGGADWPMADVIREGDGFRYWLDGEGYHLIHEPTLGNKAPVIGAYCRTNLRPSGEVRFAVIDVDEIEASHHRSQSYIQSQKKGFTEDGPWVTDWNEMAKKTALLRLRKYLPTSPKMEIVGENEAMEFDGTPRNVISASPSQSAASPRLSTAASVLGKLTGPAPDTQHEAAAADDAADDAPRTREPGED